MGVLNKVLIMGRVTRNPEVKYIPGRDLAVAKFGMAMTKKTKSKEETCFIDVIAFGKTAEMCGEYVTKGMPLLIEGRLQYSTWEADGGKRSKHEIVIENLQFAESKNARGGSGSSFGGEGIEDEDDIPF